MNVKLLCASHSLAVFLGMYVGISHVLHYKESYPTITTIEKLIEVPAKVKTLDELINDKSKQYGFPPAIVQSIVSQESSKDITNTVKRYEPKLKASSIGIMQVMEYHATKTCGLNSAKDLYGPDNMENNIDCGLIVLADCRQYVASKFKDSLTPAETLTKTLNCYNGGTTYSKSIIARLGEYVFQNMSKFS